MGKAKGAGKKRVVKKKEEVAKDVEIDSNLEDNDTPDDVKVDEKEDTNNIDNEHSEEESQEEDDADKDEVVEKKAAKGRGRQGKAGGKAAPKAAAAKKGGKRGRKSVTPAPAKKSKKEVEEKSEEDEGEDKEYEVEKILEVRFRKGGKREFLIQWKGYGAKKATWEPEENLECQDLLSEFMAKVGDLKSKQQHELRVDRKQTKPYMDSKRNQGVRSSRRFTSQPRDGPRTRPDSALGKRPSTAGLRTTVKTNKLPPNYHSQHQIVRNKRFATCNFGKSKKKKCC